MSLPYPMGRLTRSNSMKLAALTKKSFLSIFPAEVLALILWFAILPSKRSTVCILLTCSTFYALGTRFLYEEVRLLGKKAMNAFFQAEIQVSKVEGDYGDYGTVYFDRLVWRNGIPKNPGFKWVSCRICFSIIRAESLITRESPQLGSLTPDENCLEVSQK